MLLNCGVGEDSWESLDCKEIKPVNLTGNQSWKFIGRTNAEAKAPILWLSDAKNWLLGKDPDAGKNWKQEEKGMSEDEIIGWHHWLEGHEFEQALGIGDGQGSLVSCSPRGHKESDMTELNWTEPEVNQKTCNDRNITNRQTGKEPWTWVRRHSYQISEPIAIHYRWWLQPWN